MLPSLLRVACYVFSLLGVLAAQAPRPNVIFFFVDDLGYGDLGSFWQDGRTATKKFDTPALDAMAAAGAKMTHHYVSASVCAPARASLMQGRHQGHCDVRDSQFDKALPDNHTIASVLQAAGYRTIHIGKGGLSGSEGSTNLSGTGSQNLAAHPLDRGFDRFFGYLFHSDGHEHYPANGTTNKGAHIYDDFRQVTDASLDLYTTDAWTAAAKKEIIDEATDGDDEPFFLYLAYDTPHFKMQRPAVAYPALDTDGDATTGGIQWTTATDGSGRVRYASTADGTGVVDAYTHPDIPSGWVNSEKQHVGMIRRIDNSIADILRTLEDLGIDEETLCVFSSDNGPHNEGNNPRTFESFANMEGIKRDMWESGIRVPTIVHWPGQLAGATGDPANIHEIDMPSAIWDWMPTFCELAGVTAPAWCDGVSLAPTLTGNGTQRDKGYLYFEFQSGGSTPNWSEFPNHGGETKGQMQCLRIGDYMGIRTGISTGDEPFQIYDVTTDPGQATNLASTLTSLQSSMQALAVTARKPGAGVTRPYDGKPMPSVGPGPLTPGIDWRRFTDPGATWQWVPEFRDLTPEAAGVANGINLDVRPSDEHFGLLFSGYLEVPSAGTYTFRLTSDTGADLFLHDRHVIDEDFDHGGNETSSGVDLEAGLHPIRLYYRHTTGTRSLALEWSGPGFAMEPVPDSALFSVVPPELTAVDDTATTRINESVLIDVLANDFDDGLPAPISIQSVTTPASGLTMIESGQIRYTPVAGFQGMVVFDYTITDGDGTESASVTVEVVPQQAPVAVDDVTTTPGGIGVEGSPVTIPVLSNDTDPDGGPSPLSIASVGTPSGGAVQVVGDDLVYTPNADFFGIDNFNYEVTDGLESTTAWVSVNVTATPAGLTAFWDFEGDLVEQVSGIEGNPDGSAAANGVALAPGSSSALSLPVAGSLVQTGTNGGLQGPGSFTVIASIQTTSTSDGCFFLNRISGSPGGADLRLLTKNNGDLRIEMNSGGASVLAGVNLNDGNPHVVAAVFDSASGDSFRDVDLYVDGTLYDITDGTDHPVNLSSGADIHFGRDNIGILNRPFVGIIDDVAIFDEALSLAELDAVAANGISPELNLFSLWVADESFGIHPSERDFGADPDGDRLANGVEAWLGTNPGEFNPGLTGLSIDGTVATFTHSLNPAPPTDLVAVYEWSLNMEEWYDADGTSGPSGGPTVDVQAVPSGPSATVTATASEAVERLFLRLRVDQE